jgi:hypothetical protein
MFWRSRDQELLVAGTRFPQLPCHSAFAVDVLDGAGALCFTAHFDAPASGCTDVEWRPSQAEGRDQSPDGRNVRIEPTITGGPDDTLASWLGPFETDDGDEDPGAGQDDADDARDGGRS